MRAIGLPTVRTDALCGPTRVLRCGRVLTSAELAQLPPLDASAYHPPPVLLKPSHDPSLPPSVFFGAGAGVTPPPGTVAVPAAELGRALPLFKIASPTYDYVSLRLCLLKAGFRRIAHHPDTADLTANLIMGKSQPLGVPKPGSHAEKRYLVSRLRHGAQRFNHFPASHASLGCKEGLLNTLKAPDQALFHPNATQDDVSPLSVMPRTWVWPQQRDAILQHAADQPASAALIWKPARGSCGRGIFLMPCGAAEAVAKAEDQVRQMAEAARLHEHGVPQLFARYVVQEYIANPMLIDKKKFDLRLYVGVTRFGPTVVAYRHSLGFARFAAAEYSGDVAAHKFSHLTNFSVGRRLFDVPADSPPQPPSATTTTTTTTAEAAAADEALVARLQAVKEASERAAGLKWDLDALQAVLAEEPDRVTAAPGHQLDVQQMWTDVDALIRKVLVAARRPIAAELARNAFPESYFELYGFDIMFDDRGRPWLIEVNTLPSLESSSVRDYHVKSRVVADLLNLAQVRLFDRPEDEAALFVYSKAHGNAGLADPSPSKPLCVEAPNQDVRCDEFPAPLRETLGEPSPAAASRLLSAAQCLQAASPTAPADPSLALRLLDEARDVGGFRRIL